MQGMLWLPAILTAVSKLGCRLELFLSYVVWPVLYLFRKVYFLPVVVSLAWLLEMYDSCFARYFVADETAPNLDREHRRQTYIMMATV